MRWRRRGEEDVPRGDEAAFLGHPADLLVAPFPKQILDVIVDYQLCIGVAAGPHHGAVDLPFLHIKDIVAVRSQLG